MMRDETLAVADIAEIFRLLPHRYPFLLVDRVIDMRGDEPGTNIPGMTGFSGKGANCASFIVRFLMPMIEGIAQTACVLALRLMPPTERRRSMLFMTIDKAKFRKPVRPGDTLEYHVDKVAKRRNIWWYRGEAKVGGVLVAEAELGACLAEK